MAMVAILRQADGPPESRCSGLSVGFQLLRQLRLERPERLIGPRHRFGRLRLFIEARFRAMPLEVSQLQQMNCSFQAFAVPVVKRRNGICTSQIWTLVLMSVVCAL